MPPDLIRSAQAQLAGGHFDQARALLVRAVERNPSDPVAASLMAATLVELSRPEQARFYARKARDLNPAGPDLLYNLGRTFLLIGDHAEAVEVLGAAAAASPRDPAILAALADGLVMGDRFLEAEEVCRRGLEQFPGDPLLTPPLAGALLWSGRARGAVAAIRAALAAHPGDLYLAGMLPFAMNYAGDLDPREITEAHTGYGRMLEAQYGRLTPPVPGSDPERPLSIGLLSGDLRAHAVAWFLTPFLEHHDRRALRITCYSTSTLEDAVSARLRSLVAGWRRVASQSIHQLADTIRQDRIDLLIDLSGHTGGHRLPVFQLSPAPVAATYLGYPATTGLRTVAYRIVDGYSDPPEPWYDALASERLWRLDPCGLCYQVPPVAPEPSPPPSASGAPFTFGSFNNPAKHDDDAIALYARALTRVPGSRMLLKYRTLSEQNREVLARRFESAGVARDRLILEPPGRDQTEMLSAYGRVDVMLDSYPYHGTTTTCEALAMGVPVVTRAGRHSAARVGVSLLTNVGLPELIAGSDEQFGGIAAELASDPARLASLRSLLRERLMRSPLGDARGFAARFGEALRAMWRAATAGG